MCPIKDHIHALRCVACSRAAGGVVVVASARQDKDTIRLLTIQCDGCSNRASQVVVAIRFWATKATWRSLGEVITAAGLVINDSDKAGSAIIEGVLCGGIRNTTGRKRGNISYSAIRAALYLVEWATIAAIQGASGAIGSNTGRATSRVDITWPCNNK